MERTWGETVERKETAVALGLFDGVHLGHRAVLKTACTQSENGLIPAVFTFEPETALYKKCAAKGYIYGQEMKRRLFMECGMEQFCFLPFEDVRGLTGEDFAGEILCKRMNAGFVCCGSDFRFGKGASCGVDELRKFGELYGFRVDVVSEVRCGDTVVSSSEIRRLLSEGSIEKANELLGRPYTVSGKIVDGNHIGRTIDFPTINQNFSSGQLVPAYGVYSAETVIDGEKFRAVTNIGVKPTISGERSPLAETHILGFSGDLYGKELDVELTGFIRHEKKFSSLDELKKQILNDISAVNI